MFDFFTKKLPFKTKLEPEKEPKTEQESLEEIQEPDAQVIDIHKTINYMSLYDDKFSSLDELIDTYRNMAANYEISEALDEIENDAIVVEDNESVSLNLERTELSESIKKKVQKEFDEVLKLINWNTEGQSIFRQWYIDGRMYSQKVMFSDVSKGIQKVNILDTKKVRKYKDKETKEILYKYDKDSENSYILTKDSVSEVPSGIKDVDGKYWVSELHSVIRPFNNYRLIMDSALIYYITRAPQRRAFYIDIGTSPTKKGEEKIKTMMNKFSQRISYDSNSGKIIQQKRSSPIIEDYWLATRGDTRGTKIETIQGDSGLIDPEILAVFRKPLYKSLGVPYARVDEDSGSTIDFSNTGEMTRQELKFYKKIQKLRNRFSKFFTDLLKTQLISKKIMVLADWEKIKVDIFYDWKNDSYITMTKQLDVLSKQIDIANELEQYVGKYFSHEYVRKEVFKQTQDDIEINDEQIEEESKNEKYNESEPEM